MAIRTVLCLSPLLAVLLACSASQDPSAGGAESAGQSYGGTGEVPAVAPASSPSAGALGARVAAHDTATTILNATFEDASPQCNDWTSPGARAIRSIPAHTGDYACKVCATGTAPVLALAHGTGTLEPGRYVLSAWVRGHTPSPELATATLEADTPEGIVAQDGAPVALADAYGRIEVALDLGATATALRARIQAPASAEQCVLVDDVVLVRR